MPRTTEVASVGEKRSTENDNNHQWTKTKSSGVLAENGFAYIDEDVPAQRDDNASPVRNQKTMSVDNRQQQVTVTKQNLTSIGNCTNSMRTSPETNHGNSKATNVTIEQNITTNGGIATKANENHHHHQQLQPQQKQQQQIQRLSHIISGNSATKVEKTINGNRLNGCCCRRRPPSSSEECVDDDQLDNYWQRSKNNNNNIKMTITLTATTVSPSRKKSECGPLPATTTLTGPTESLGTLVTTQAMTVLTTATTTNALEMASTPVTVTTATATTKTNMTPAKVPTLSASTSPSSSSSSSSPSPSPSPSPPSSLSPIQSLTKAKELTQRIMIGCGPNDNSNESDANREKCTKQTKQLQAADTVTNDTGHSTASYRKCNDECKSDNTMTPINTVSMQSTSVTSSPSLTKSSLSHNTTTSHGLPSQSARTSASAVPSSTAISSASQTPFIGHEVLAKSGNKFESKLTSTGGVGLISGNTSNSRQATAACNGSDSLESRHSNLNNSRTSPSRRSNSESMCDKKNDSFINGDYNLDFLTLDGFDDSEDPYYVLQEYLERVKNEINEVFEQYKAKKNDESTRCTDADTTADVINQMVADNKLPANEMSCRLNDTTDRTKVNETKNSTSSDQNDINATIRAAGMISTGTSTGTGTTTSSSSSNSGRYLTVPVAVDATATAAAAASIESTIMSTNTFPSLNHDNDQTKQPSASANSGKSRRASTLKRLNSHNDYLARTDLENPHHSSDSSDDVNIWANKFLQELDNLMGSDKWSNVCTTTTATMTNGCSGGCGNARVTFSPAPNKISIPKLEKHVTIPLQSFNLDCHRLDSPSTKHLNPNGGGIYQRTLSAPNGNDSNPCQPKSTPGSSVLKVEENNTIKDKCRRQFESDMDTILVRSTMLLSQSHAGAGAGAGPTTIPKRERAHQNPATAVTVATSNGSYLLHNNDATKKGSTSTIWTSEESILRSVGAADEDNNSTSSSACEEASGVLSSGKSGNSLDSSGLDNDNNESGIGTATPPKEVGFWKNTPDNDSLTSSLDALRKIKFQKGSSVASSDDPDLLEVLSLYDEAHDDDDVDDIDVLHHEDETNHDHEEYETGTFDGYDSIDCENTNNHCKAVVLRKKSNLHINDNHSHCGSKDSAIHLLPYSRSHKCRSHSLDVASPMPMPLAFRHDKENKGKGKMCLALRQEPFQSILPAHFHDLPSPSSASLHSGHESLGLQELTTKSNSAPLLLKKERKRDDFSGQKQTLRYSRSQSDRYLAEIEAVEACKWLRAAGFPQYAQMYEDHQFPIDLTNVAKDHTNLENDPLQSLYRRLCILNRCANMRLDSSHKTHTPQKEDSDDENCALSENWTFQPHIRRWSRIGEMGLELPTKLSQDKTESSSKESSPDRFEDDDSYDISGAALNLSLPHEHTDATANNDSDPAAVRLRRTGSERLKDGAKALLRRVESIKSRRRKRQNREGIVISGPQALDLSQLGQRSFRKPDAVYSTPPSPSAVSPMHMYPKSPLFHHIGQNELKVPSQSENFLSPNRINSPKRTPTTPRSMRTSPLHFFAAPPMPHLKEGKSDDSSSYYSDSQESSSTGGKLTLSLRKAPSKSRRFLQRTGKVDDIGAHSDSECHQGRKFVFKDTNSNTTEMKVRKLTRGGSLNLGKDPKKREGFRSTSFRTRSTVRKDHKNSESDTENVKIRKSPVVRWHSFQEEERPHMIFKKCFSRKVEPEKTEGTPFVAMSCGQLQIIRKLALVILTGYMERYCPTHRSGWNWELPKFIKKIKMPDYKDKKVFGVPLLLILQRTGQTLPVAVRAAFRWLQLNALDQIGLFRKSGVKSRIFKLKERIELADSSAECMDVFDTQQAYDVADMLKQYFRDLPESLLTNKMSETFAAIFQHLPPDVRLDAVQCAVLLLPDENREILFALLEFLTLVADNSQFNQMTANNLAVCLAPSLFHTSISTGSSSVTASPRRRKTTGVPDAKELSEAKASHECLSFMIEHYRQIFTASRERISKCNFGYMEESKPVQLEALGEGMQFHNWRGYLYECTSATIKEGREKSRGWMSITSLDANVDISYKKVGDGHPLRLWRCATEVEGPPKDVLDYILKQRASWDINLLQSQIIKKLDERTEIFQYAFDGQMCTDFCVLRSWQTDLPRGACVIVETSIDHPKAKPIFGSIRGVVLASRYLIEPCGSGRSRVMHLARVDIKGKTPEWYNKSYGHICSHYLSKIRLAFRNIADGPETKV